MDLSQISYVPARNDRDGVLLRGCSGCNHIKDHSQFGKAKTVLGLQRKCRPCMNAYQRAHNRKRSPTPPDRQRRQLLRTRYSISVEQYEAMLEKQGGGCALCGRSDGDRSGRRLHVDHDHSCCPSRDSCCGKCIRGLLCQGCNTALGHFDDDTERLQRAMEYLS
jgi:hypothetical protein